MMRVTSQSMAFIVSTMTRLINAVRRRVNVSCNDVRCESFSSYSSNAAPHHIDVPFQGKIVIIVVTMTCFNDNWLNTERFNDVPYSVAEAEDGLKLQAMRSLLR
jgi:hypothetical protein